LLHPIDAGWRKEASAKSVFGAAREQALLQLSAPTIPSRHRMEQLSS